MIKIFPQLIWILAFAWHVLSNKLNGLFRYFLLKCVQLLLVFLCRERSNRFIHRILTREVPICLMSDRLEQMCLQGFIYAWTLAIGLRYQNNHLARCVNFYQCLTPVYSFNYFISFPPRNFIFFPSVGKKFVGASLQNLKSHPLKPPP